tara:strand:- start:293 stop:1144 length:852 start_codon:yes stop_codon:yes gene_type:complete
MTQRQNKTIEQEFDKITRLLKNRENFAFVRYGDGEISAISNESFTCNQWQLTAGNSFTEALKEGLITLEGYYVGIPCGCMEKKDGFRAYLRKHHPIDPQWETFASLFCNALHPRTISQVLPLIKSYEIVITANEHIDLSYMEKQGFNVVKHVPITMNAWKDYKKIQSELMHYVRKNKPHGKLFLFCAGPVSNTIIHHLYKENANNIYLDMGSAIDKQLGLQNPDRCHYQWTSWKQLAKCYWEYKDNPLTISCDSHSKTKLERSILRLKAICHRLAGRFTQYIY